MEFDGATVTVRETNVTTPLMDGITVGVLGGGFVGFSVAEETAFRLDFVDLQNRQGGGVLTGNYTYDPLNRRVHKQVNDGTQVTATVYVYDGWRCIEEWEATWPQGALPANPAYVRAAQYVHGGYIDELLVMRRDVDGNGSLEEYFYHADDQFNIVAVTNASGAVVERYEYGPFSEPTILDPSGAVREASAIGNHNLWNGREYDAETGLYYYRLRYLDPELGRFTTLDPIGLWGDPNNLGNGYAYVGNRPWTGLNPFGLGITTFLAGLGYNASDREFWSEFYSSLEDNSVAIFHPMAPESADNTSLGQAWNTRHRNPVLSYAALTGYGTAVVAASSAGGLIVYESMGGTSFAIGGEIVGNGVSNNGHEPQIPPTPGNVEQCPASSPGETQSHPPLKPFDPGAESVPDPPRRFSGNYEDGQRAYRENVPRDRHNNPVPEPEANGPHTRLQRDKVDPTRIYSATEFDSEGQAVRRTDFAGRPGDPLPHAHEYNPETQSFDGQKVPVNRR